VMGGLRFVCVDGGPPFSQEAAIRIVAWATLGTLKPTGEDFAVVRLVLLALLPQIGGSCSWLGDLPCSRHASSNR
jgi:hypothetical protein